MREIKIKLKSTLRAIIKYILKKMGLLKVAIDWMSVNARLKEALSEIENQRFQLETLVRMNAPRSEVYSKALNLRKDIMSGGQPRDKLFILGSGPSLLRLSPDEKDEIGSHRVLAMNRYLIFWEKVGIWPEIVFLADSRGVGRSVFQEYVCMEYSEKLPCPLFFLERHFKATGGDMLPTLYFERDDRKGNRLQWAKGLDQPLFFCRGSLTSLINLCVILKLAKEIILVGIDLNEPGSFFDSEKEIRPQFFNHWDSEAAEKGGHATVLEVNSWKGSMLDYWHLLNEQASKSEIALSSFNPNSLLVTEGLLPAFQK